MQQPLFWILLVIVVLLGASARLAHGAPLLRRRAVPLKQVWLGIAAVSLLALTLHCATMFFTPWTDAVPGGAALGREIRKLGAFSQLTYWLPAAALLVALLRVWWPGLVLLGVTLSGVGITMFWSFPLPTHLAWLAAAVVTVTFVASCLVAGERRRKPLARRLQ